jgi:hypothetical protein
MTDPTEVEIHTTVQRPRWLVQYRRMRRWRGRMAAPEDDPDYELDNIHAFFIACFHLRDWLVNDPELPFEVQQAVVPFVKGALPLHICEHLANGLKHLVLRDPRLQTPIMLSTGETPTVSIRGGEVLGDAATVADRCIQAWDGFLRDHDLLR